jgi:predicted ATPase
MTGLSIGDLVLVYLEAVDGDEGHCTPSAIGDALGIGTIVSDRIELMSALSALTREGHIEKRTSGDETGRIRYELTGAGNRRAEQLHESLADEEILLLRNGTQRSVPITDARDELGVSTIAGVLGRASDGIIRLGDVPDDPFVGRDEELATLDTRLSALSEGEGGVVRLIGPRGVGKTELLSRTIDRARERDLDVIEISCRPDASEPYQPVRSALADRGEADLFERTGGQPDAAASLEGHRTGLFLDVRDALANVAGDTPLLVTVDDLHEATSATVDLLAFLADNRPDGLLLAVASRPSGVDQCDCDDDERDRLEAVGGTETVDIELSPLDRTLTHELIVRLLGDSGVPESLSEEIYERTGGTPLFVTDFVTQLLESGTVDPDAGLFPAPDEGVPIPETVREAIAARLEPLSEEAMTVIEYGAIIGETVPIDILSTASEHAEPRLREFVDLLVGAQLWLEDDPVRFESEMVRDVVLEEIEPERRERLHRRVAAAYESRDGEDVHVAAASHHEQAGDLDQAMEAYRAAGDRAIDVYANEEAIECYQQAVELTRSLDREDALIELLESIGRVYYVSGEHDPAKRYYQFLLDRTEDPDRIQQAYRDLAEIAISSGDFEQADTYARKGIEAVEEPTRISCRLRGHLGWTKQLRGRIEEAAEEYERQQELAEQLDDDDRRAGVYNNLAMVAYHRGDIKRAIDLGRRSVEANERAGSLRDTAATYNNLGTFYFHAGDLDAARDAFEAAAERGREVGDRAKVVTFEGNIGVCLKRRGKFEQAWSRCQSALETATTVGMRKNRGVILVALGGIDCHRGNFADARDRFETALEIGEDIDYTLVIARARNQLARLDIYEDDLESARTHARAAREAATSTEPADLAQAHLRLGDVAFAMEDYDEALERYEHGLQAARDCASKRWVVEASNRVAVTRSKAKTREDALSLLTEELETAREIDEPATLARAQLALARCYRHHGRFEEAADELDDAIEIAEELGTIPVACQIHIERGKLAVARTDPDSVRVHFTDALELALESSADLLERRCRETLASAVEPA